MIVKTYWTFVSSSSGQCGQQSRAASNRQAFVGRSCAWKLETLGTGQQPPAGVRFVLWKIFRIQEKWNSTSLFRYSDSRWKPLHFGCRVKTILLDTFYIFMCSLILLLQDYISSRIGGWVSTLDIYYRYYLVSTITRAAVDTRPHFTRLWSGLSMKYESYCHLSQHTIHWLLMAQSHLADTTKFHIFPLDMNMW